MSNQCKCPSSRLFKHRADKCTFSTKNTRRTAHSNSNNAAPPIPPPTEVVEPQDASDSQEPPPVIQDGADAADSATEAGHSPAEIVQPALPVASSTNELSAAQEVAASNFTLPNGNEQCDCIAYRFKKHRKKRCSWKKHVAVGLASATIVAGTVVLATVVADDKDKETAKDDQSTDPSHDSKEARSKKMTSQKKGVAIGLATASIIAGTAALATVVVCDIQKDKKIDEFIPSLVEGVGMHSTAAPEVPTAAEGETDEPNEAVSSNIEATQGEPEEEPESEVEEEEESEEDFEARLQAQVRADEYAAMWVTRLADAAVLREQRLEEQRLQRERSDLQQLSV